MSEVQKAIQSMMQAVASPTGSGRPTANPRVVCISRDCGAGGDDIAHLLAKRLGVEVYDHVILDKIAQRLNADPAALKALDSGVSHFRDMWFYSLVTGQNLTADGYKRHLVNVLLSLGRSGGVIIGRGGHLVLAHSGALRVRFTGSEDLCAQRIADAQGISLEAARKTVEDTNQKRGKFIWDTFHERLNDPKTFDLVINTDHITNNAKVVDMLVEAMNMIAPANAKAKAAQ